MNRILVAILAAGESRRMGQPKLCLPWGKTTILGHVLQQWREAGALDLLVIQAPGAETPVALELDRLGIPPEQRTATLAPERGMMGSVITAARRACELPGLQYLIIALGDQPQIHAETLRTLLEACRANNKKTEAELIPRQARDDGRVIRVVFQGKPGHPLALPKSLLAELSTTSSETLRDFIGLSSKEVCDLTCRDSGVLLDLDTPHDYAQALRGVDEPLT